MNLVPTKAIRQKTVGFFNTAIDQSGGGDTRFSYVAQPFTPNLLTDILALVVNPTEDNAQNAGIIPDQWNQDVLTGKYVSRQTTDAPFLRGQFLEILPAVVYGMILYDDGDNKTWGSQLFAAPLAFAVANDFANIPGSQFTFESTFFVS